MAKAAGGLQIEAMNKEELSSFLLETCKYTFAEPEIEALYNQGFNTRTALTGVTREYLAPLGLRQASVKMLVSIFSDRAPGTVEGGGGAVAAGPGLDIMRPAGGMVADAAAGSGSGGRAATAAGLGMESLARAGRYRRAGVAAGQGSGSTATGGGSNLMAWTLGIPLMILALAVDRGVGVFDDTARFVKAFICRNDVALATTYKSIKGVGVLASVSLGVAAAVGAFFKRLRVHPGRPRVLRLGARKQQLAPATTAVSNAGLARKVLQAQTSAAGQQVD